MAEGIINPCIHPHRDKPKECIVEFYNKFKPWVYGGEWMNEWMNG